MSQGQGGGGQGWGQPGQGQPAQQPYGNNWGYPDAGAAAIAIPASTYGDAAGEYMNMKRGKYSATVYVYCAFLMQMGLVGSIVGAVPALAVGGLTDDAGMAGIAFLVVGLPAGIVLAWLTFRDRWKCIEAYSSRFCSGLMNLSLMYVPIIALVYANVRGIQKLAKK